jgi:hypothetical protein
MPRPETAADLSSVNPDIISPVGAAAKLAAITPTNGIAWAVQVLWLQTVSNCRKGF